MKVCVVASLIISAIVILIEIPWIFRSSSGLALVLIAIVVTNILNAIAIITKVKD